MARSITKIVGVLNITEDSFSDGGKYIELNDALDRFDQMRVRGADLIDIGAQSTNYESKILDPQEEMDRLCSFMEKVPVEDRGIISVDTFNPKTAKAMIGYGISMINDVKGGQSREMLELIAQNPHITYVAMCSIIIPTNQSHRFDSVSEIFMWIENLKLQLEKHNVDINKVVIDPGIGFVSGPELSLEIIKSVSDIRALGLPVMIGHSRKSFFKSIFESSISDRDIETLAVSIWLRSQKVDYIRVHNMEFHKRAFDMLDLLG